LYKHVKIRPDDLIVVLFDIYANGSDSPYDQPNDAWILPNIASNLKRIFRTPCETVHQIASIDDILYRCLEKAKLANTKTSFTRRQFKHFIRDPGTKSSFLKVTRIYFLFYY
jgi:hypothetical protein